MLESLETQITILLEAVTDDGSLEADTRRTAKRHCRELRAELESVRCVLPHETRGISSSRRTPTRGPEACRSSSTDRGRGVTTVTDPMAARREARRCRADDRTGRGGDRQLDERDDSLEGGDDDE